MFRKIKKWLILGLLVIGCGVAAVSVGQKAARYLQKENQLLATAGEQTIEALRSVGEAGQTFLDRAGEEQMTILFTGADESWGTLDALLLVAIDLNRSSVRVIEIPTDTYFNRASSTSHHIGSIYASAAAKALRRGDGTSEAVRKGNIAIKGFLKENMGVAIDHTISMNRTGLSRIVDAVGGVSVKLPRAIDLDDNSRDLHLHLSAGSHTLNGKDAVALSCCRSSDGSLNGQKIFLSALFGKIKQSLSLSTALELVKTGYSSAVSDLALADLIPLSKALLGISGKDIKLSVLPTHDADDENGIACKVLDRAGTVAMLAENLPQSGITDAAFDKNRLFTTEGPIDKLYYGN